MRRYFDGVVVEYSDASAECSSDVKKTVLLSFFIVVGFVVGIVLCIFIINWRLKKNGYRLENMLRSRERFDNDNTMTNRNQNATYSTAENPIVVAENPTFHAENSAMDDEKPTGDSANPTARETSIEEKGSDDVEAGKVNVPPTVTMPTDKTTTAPTATQTSDTSNAKSFSDVPLQDLKTQSP